MQEVQQLDIVSIYFRFQSFANGLSVSSLLFNILTKGSLDCSRVMAYLAQFIISISTDFSVHTLSAAATSITQLIQNCHRTDAGIISYRREQWIHVALL